MMRSSPWVFQCLLYTLFFRWLMEGFNIHSVSDFGSSMETEIREAELMVSPLSGKSYRRMAHFLKPSSTYIENLEPDHLPKSLFCGTAISMSQALSSQIRFTGWLNPQEQWNTWKEKLRGKYENVWRDAGIFEAIEASTYRMPRSDDLVLGLAQKWYPETNSFIFSWGEATITLEDVMVCGGYSVVGSYVLMPLEDEEWKQIERRLDEVRRNLVKTKAKTASHLPWLRHFMEEEGELEHVAFLSLWLSKFVFPKSISKQVFTIAIHLARGTRIALAPAVLASIYRDLTLLKGKFDEVVKSVTKSDKCDISGKPIILRAPFQLVQIWALERFPSFPLKSNRIKYAQPLTAKWHNESILHYRDVSLALDSSAKSFLWQPYKDSSKLYNEKDRWICFTSDSHKYLECFAYCLRDSDLVGIDCVESYLPHRVAMQFGLDQDIPEKVTRCKENNPTIAWRNYDRPMTEAMLCIAAVALSSTLEAAVTSKYYEWWKQSKLRSAEQPGMNSVPMSISENLSQTSSEMGSPVQKDQTGNYDQDHGSTSHSHENDSKIDGVENMANGENMKEAGGSKRAKLDVKMDNVIDKSERGKEGKSGDKGNEGECVSDSISNLDIFSNFEIRIEYLERVVTQLKAASSGHQVWGFESQN